MKLLTKEVILKTKRTKTESSPTVYFLIKNNEVVYVGRSIQGMARIHTHRNINFNYFNFVYVLEELLRETELRYIIKFTPKYNRIFPKSNRYKTPTELGTFFNLTWEEVIKICQKHKVKIHTLNNAMPEKYRYTSRVAVIDVTKFTEIVS